MVQISTTWLMCFNVLTSLAQWKGTNKFSVLKKIL